MSRYICMQSSIIVTGTNLDGNVLFDRLKTEEIIIILSSLKSEYAIITFMFIGK